MFLLGNVLMTIMTAAGTSARHRGAFIVLEGLDRCGKTTQTALLQQRLGNDAVLKRFPNRSTATGQLIDQYLQSSSNLDDRAVHLLFSANRWEASDEICRLLATGHSVICDRYAYSGVAFSSAKGLDLDWCKAPDQGLPAPDCVIFLDVSQDDAEQRGGYDSDAGRYGSLSCQWLTVHR
jgi:dTMP kinase